jgi:hypothetical protein
MSTFTSLESRMKLPSTIDYAFLKRAQRSKSTFYLTKQPTPSAYLSYFLAQDQIAKFPIASLTRYIQKVLLISLDSQKKLIERPIKKEPPTNS